MPTPERKAVRNITGQGNIHGTSEITKRYRKRDQGWLSQQNACLGTVMDRARETTSKAVILPSHKNIEMHRSAERERQRQRLIPRFYSTLYAQLKPQVTNAGPLFDALAGISSLPD